MPASPEGETKVSPLHMAEVLDRADMTEIAAPATRFAVGTAAAPGAHSGGIQSLSPKDRVSEYRDHMTPCPVVTSNPSHPRPQWRINRYRMLRRGIAEKITPASERSWMMGTDCPPHSMNGRGLQRITRFFC
jgi:hypothetical protein